VIYLCISPLRAVDSFCYILGLLNVVNLMPVRDEWKSSSISISAVLLIQGHLFRPGLLLPGIQDKYPRFWDCLAEFYGPDAVLPMS